MMVFIQAVAIGSTFALDTPYLLTGLASVAALGITAALDVTNGTDIFGQLSDYYTAAGDGTLIWLVGTDPNTAFATYVAAPLFDTLVKFTGQNDPAERAKMIGVSYKPPTTLQTATDFPADVAATVIALQAKQVALFPTGLMFSALVDGYNMSSTVTPSTIGTQATGAAFAISLCITGVRPNGVSGIGAALGRFARISIGHGFGEVDDGPIPFIGAYLTNSVQTTTASTLVVGHIYTVLGGAVTYNSVVYQIGAQITVVSGHLSYTTTAGGFLVDNLTPVGNVPGTTITGLSDTSITALGQKQYMFLRTWFGQSGVYWNDAATCNPATKALSSQEYNRVANHLAAAALAFFIQQMGKSLPIDTATGSVAQGWLNLTTQQFTEQFIDPLAVNTGTGDISGATLIVTGPNFLATKKLNFKLKIVPTVILGGVAGTIEFTATL